MIGADGSSATVVRGLVQTGSEVRFNVVGPTCDREVRFWGDLPPNPMPAVESALAIALLPAMAVGGELSLPGPISQQLRRSLPDIQAILRRIDTESSYRDSSIHQIDVNSRSATGLSEPAIPHSASGVGAFFSGGADSLATLLSNPDITDLIYVHGFDIPIDRPEISATVERRLAGIAETRGKRLRVIRTDVRSLLDPILPWEIVHGPALAAVSLLLAPACGRVLIGAGMSYDNLLPRGSHPLLDHLWSTEVCRVEHHGAHLARAEKLRMIAGSQEALDALRVCWRHVDLYNCGACEKCLRTMIALEALGALERCPTFSAPLDLGAVADLRFSDAELPLFWHENLAFAKELDASADLIAAIEACLARTELNRSGDSDTAKELQDIIESRSWRLTAPLRGAGTMARRLRQKGHV